MVNKYICLLMKQKKIIPGPVLMLLSILGIALFQFYWLRQNYHQEEKTLAIKTAAGFRQTIQQLQIAKLKLSNISTEAAHKKLKYLFINKDENSNSKNIPLPHNEEIFSTIKVIQGKLNDSLKNNYGAKAGMVISINETRSAHDSLRLETNITEGGPDRIMQFLYGIDSLQDSLQLKEIDSAYSQFLKKDKTIIPFSVVKLNSHEAKKELPDNTVSVGFANPIIYKLQLGNTVPYVLKRLTLPIFFSVLLLGITMLAFVLLYRNILQQKRLAQLKNDFISNITHELKTPVATVSVAIEALKNFSAIEDPQRTKEYLDISSNELQRLNLLVDKVLKLSMFEKKEVELSYESVNLKTIVEEVLLSLKLQFEKHGATVTLNAKGDMHLQGDLLHLQSVVFNLLDNAIKYSKDAPVIDIEMEEKNNSIQLKFTDNGIGIPAAYKEKIFEKFFRIPQGDTHNAKGYGLGLSYAAQVIKKHGGSISVDSKATGTGTTFMITLPKQPA